jgi:hypothetical protein
LIHVKNAARAPLDREFGSWLVTGPINPDQLSGQITRSCDDRADPTCLTNEVRVERTNNDRQDFFVRYRLISLSEVCDRRDVMSESAQLLRYRVWEVLVREKARHNQAASFCWISSSISSRWDRTYAHALAKSSARN